MQELNNTTELETSTDTAIDYSTCYADYSNLIAKYANNFKLHNDIKKFKSKRKIKGVNSLLELAAGDWIQFENGYGVKFISEIFGFDQDGYAYVIWDCFWCSINLEKRLIKRIDKFFLIDEKTQKKVNTIIDKSKYLEEYYSELLTKGIVSVGYRQSTGYDSTFEIYSKWVDIIRILRNNGNHIKEDNVKHDNGWATLSGGFWNETIFFL